MQSTTDNSQDRPDTDRMQTPAPTDSFSIEALDALNELPVDKRQAIVNSIIAMERESFSGPIPHPRLLKGYEEVMPGSAERILAMAEREQAHMAERDNRIVTGSLGSTKRGQWMGFTIALLFCAASTALGLMGQPVLAGIIGGGTLVSLVTVFVTNKPAPPNDPRP